MSKNVSEGNEVWKAVAIFYLRCDFRVKIIVINKMTFIEGVNMSSCRLNPNSSKASNFPKDANFGRTCSSNEKELPGTKLKKSSLERRYMPALIQPPKSVFNFSLKLFTFPLSIFREP